MTTTVHPPSPSASVAAGSVRTLLAFLRAVASSHDALKSATAPAQRCRRGSSCWHWPPPRRSVDHAESSVPSHRPRSRRKKRLESPSNRDQTIKRCRIGVSGRILVACHNPHPPTMAESSNPRWRCPSEPPSISFPSAGWPICTRVTGPGVECLERMLAHAAPISIGGQLRPAAPRVGRRCSAP
jgi:hypothetical protein